jgi:hypothetical protein
MTTIANPFDRSDLYVASQFHDAVLASVDRSDVYKPFRRQIDAWWLALAIGIQREHRKALTPTDRVKFMDGTIFSSDPWRITHLQLLGLNWFGTEALNRPSDIITAANEYANGGFDWIVEAVAGAPNRTLAIYNRIGDLLT